MRLQTTIGAWSARLALALLVPPLLIELLLQAGAGVVHLTQHERGAAPPSSSMGQADCALLCIGDSFTFGIGASSPENSYPGCVAKALSAQPIGGCSKVVNAGWPGATSRDAALELARRLEEVKPAAVALLIGANDLWRKPEALDDEETAAALRGEGAGFRWEWRTLRLLRLLFVAPEAAPSPTAEPSVAPANPAGTATAVTPAKKRSDALIGAWSTTDGEATFEDDGSAEILGREYRWARKLADLELTDVESGVVKRTRVETYPNGIRLLLPGESESRHFRRSGAGGGRAEIKRLMKAAIGSGNFERIVELATQLLAKRPEDGQMRLYRLRAAHHVGREELVEEDLAALRRQHQLAGTRDSAGVLVGALGEVGKVEEAGDFAEEELAQFGDFSALWAAVAAAAQARGDLARAREAIDRAHDLGAADAPAMRGSWLRFRSTIRMSSRDPQGALGDYFEAWSLEPKNEMGPQIRHMASHVEADDVRAVARERGIDPALAERFAVKVDELKRENDDATLVTLRGHVQRIAAMCKERGIRLLLITYPGQPLNPLLDAMRDAAPRLGATLVDAASGFESILAKSRRSDYFVADGHCNDRGYSVLADLVVAALRARS